MSHSRLALLVGLAIPCCAAAAPPELPPA
ncbi:EF-hand domain-containing protein, partial [Xanthomonas oryzae pv. oryzae]